MEKLEQYRFKILNVRLKRVYKDNGSITLVSENPKYPPKILTSGNVRILGKLVAVLSMKE